MGLLDSVLGQVMGGAQPQQQPGGPAGGLEGLGALAGMGGLDALLGGNAGSGAPAQGGLADVLGGLLANDGQMGGLGGLVSRFEQAGLGEQVGSWVGTGANQPVSPDQVQGALGSDAIAGMASRLGINAQTLLPLLASVLPLLINQFTPQGKVPERGLGNQQDLMAMLGGLLRR